MKAIVAVDKNWGIGKNNGLLFSLKADMRHFKEHTINNIVVMGRKTLLSLPGGQPLKNRINIVLGSADVCGESASRGSTVLSRTTAQIPVQTAGSETTLLINVHSLAELSGVLKGYNPDRVFVVGGATVYRTLLPFCSEAIVTKVEADGGAEVFFENLDNNKDWELTECGEPSFDCEYIIRFCRYKNIAKCNL